MSADFRTDPLPYVHEKLAEIEAALLEATGPNEHHWKAKSVSRRERTLRALALVRSLTERIRPTLSEDA